RGVVRRAAGGVERLHVDAGMLLHEVEARAGGEQQGAAGHGNAAPLALVFRQIFNGRIDRAVGGDHVLDDVVHRLERGAVLGGLPVGELHDVVAGLGLGLGGGREEELVALGGDVVDLDVDVL